MPAAGDRDGELEEQVTRDRTQRTNDTVVTTESEAGASRFVVSVVYNDLFDLIGSCVP